MKVVIELSPANADGDWMPETGPVQLTVSMGGTGQCFASLVSLTVGETGYLVEPSELVALGRTVEAFQSEMRAEAVGYEHIRTQQAIRVTHPLPTPVFDG